MYPVSFPCGVLHDKTQYGRIPINPAILVAIGHLKMLTRGSEATRVEPRNRRLVFVGLIDKNLHGSNITDNDLTFVIPFLTVVFEMSTGGAIKYGPQ